MISGIVIPTYESFPDNNIKKLSADDGNLRCKHIVETLYSARITDVVIVTDKDKSINNFPWLKGKIVYKPDALNTVLTNIQMALKNISSEDIHGVMICPLDHPLLTQKLLVTLLQNFWQSKKEIIIPVYNGEWGYPVIYGANAFPVFDNADPDESLRELTKKYKKDVHQVEIHDQGVVIKITSDDEFEKHLRKLENA